jgi:hypothetical protein
MGKIQQNIVIYAAIAAGILSSAEGKMMWSSQPATTSDFIRTAYVLGNGRLGG